MRPRNPLRDVFILTLPILVVVGYLSTATLAGFYEAEIENFHGYLNRNTRIGGPAYYLRRSLAPLWDPKPRRYLPNLGGETGQSPTRSFDLRVDGASLDALRSALPASAELWQPAILAEGDNPQKVKIRHRGQSFINFFFESRATWKIKTEKRQLVDRSRIINLSPLENRLHDHLAFVLARELGLPAPGSRVVHLYLNQRDQGLYLQEEQVDESMIRRAGRMPGDIFYGELSIPNEPKLAPKDLFWNPHLWRKKARNNQFPEEHRPYLVDLLDAVSDESIDSYDRLYALLDPAEFPLYFLALSLFGDQHTDAVHNHRLYFNPLTGRFEGIVWNPMMSMSRGKGLETMASPLFRKICRDPRFLDQAYESFYRRTSLAQIFDVLLEELERIRVTHKPESLQATRLDGQLNALRRRVTARHETLIRFERAADLRWETFDEGDRTRLVVHARGLTSQQLTGIELAGDANGVRLFEDRDFDGQADIDDREIRVEYAGNRLVVVDPEARVFVGRDFRAPYFEPSLETAESFSQYRQYTRPAYLANPYVLTSPPGGSAPAVVGLTTQRTLGEGPVETLPGAPAEYQATETLHPWQFRPLQPSRTWRLAGEVDLRDDLILAEDDRLEIEPGTRLRLGPGVSIVTRSRTHLDDVHIERLDPHRPWGVFAIQGQGGSGSVIENSSFAGGSHATLGHIYYSGMVSIHDADRVTLENSVLAGNLLGDDTLRVAACQDFEIRSSRVDNANGDAIDFDISSGSIVDSEVFGSRGDGIDLMTSNVRLIGNRVHGAGDKGISIGEASIAEVVRCTIVDSDIGIGIKDASEPLLSDVTIQGCRTGISSYDKNWRYPGGGRGQIVDSTFRANERALALDKYSTLRVESCRFSEGFEPPARALLEGRLQIVDSRVAETDR